jgi:Predicted transcriptional regulator containing an HTH domain and an uncharacterized domain shared with the mammalian protein Schlafen
MNIENNRVEYKRQLTDNFEREVVAFLNYHEGGVIYLGINDDGNVVGLSDVDKTQLKIVDRLKNNILPATMGLFDVVMETSQDKKIIKVIISSGSEKPYYLKNYGMSPKGCFVRVGSSVQQMTTSMIDNYYSHRIRITVGNTPSPRKDLTFEQLKIYYESTNLHLNNQFKRSLDLMTKSDEYNYAAYLLSDDNGVSIKVAKYAGTDKVDLIENEEYGYCSIIKATKNVLEKLNIENKTYAKITSSTRIEKSMIDKSALREAVINAIVHNDYSREVPPLFEIFSDRLMITSYGGLVSGLSEIDFFNCRSMPRNRELMRVFKDIGLVEHLGSGMNRILNAYDTSVFELTPNFLIVTFPFTDSFLSTNSKSKALNHKGTKALIYNKDSMIQEHQILDLIKNNPKITQDDLAATLKISRRVIQKHMNFLILNNIIVRTGGKRFGQWEIIKK